MIDFNKDKARRIYRKDTNEQRKRAKIVKSKKGRTTKIYAINIERKKLLKQRREKVLQNAKDRKLAKRNPIVALQVNQRANSASNDTQSITDTNDEIIDNNNHWQIQGGATVMCPPPTGSNSFIFAYVFAEKCPHWRLVPPNGSAPPNRKSWIHH